MPASVGDRDLPAFERSIRQFKVVQNETLIHEGDRPDCYFAIREGVLKGCVTSNSGAECVTRFAYPGEIVDLGATSGLWPRTLTALESTRLCRIPVDSVNTPTLKKRLVKRTADRLRDTYDFELTLTFAFTRARRLAWFLIKAEHHLAVSPSDGKFRLPMSQRDIGSHLALSAESINRDFKGLETRGLIKHHRNEVQLLRRAPLMTLAHDKR